MLNRFMKSLAPVAALLFATATTGCDGVDISIGDGDAVPLAELDMSGPAPTEIVLAGPDNVIVTEGDTLDITVEGESDVTEALRFSRSDDALAISRKGNSWGDEKATIRVTMPLPSSMVLAGSGSIELPGMAGSADATIAGSGKARVAALAAERMEVTIAGSGSLDAEGTADRLELTLAGSGKANMGGLKVERAEVNIAGSGKAGFASDGNVEANIMGSGTVDVAGNATCEINSMGSGKLRCNKGTVKAKDKDTAPKAAAAPTAPEAPEAPAAPSSADASVAEAELRAAQAEARAARAEADAARAEANALRAQAGGE